MCESLASSSAKNALHIEIYFMIAPKMYFHSVAKLKIVRNYNNPESARGAFYVSQTFQVLSLTVLQLTLMLQCGIIEIWRSCGGLILHQHRLYIEFWSSQFGYAFNLQTASPTYHTLLSIELAVEVTCQIITEFAGLLDCC